MNMATLAHSAYARASSISPSPRETEYRAFARVTRQLSEHVDISQGGFPRLAEAIHQNQRLWSMLAEDVADSANGLPDELRAQIVYLADFTRQHSMQVLRDKASPAILVEINTSVMRGLRAGSGEG